MSKRKTHFFIYTFTSLMQKGISFLLLPIYTSFLSQKDYGIVSITTSSIALLSIIFTFGLDSGIIRLYFDFRADVKTMRSKIGSLLFAIQILGLSVGSLMLLIGILFFRNGFLGIDFHPFYPLMLLILFFQPTFSLIQSLLQAMEKSKLFMVFNLSFFCVNLSLTLYFVIVLKIGAAGILLAQLIALLLFFFVGLFIIRKIWTPAFDKKVILQSFRYSIPMIPHSLGGQLAATADRYILGYYFDVRKSGLLHLGYQASQPMELIASSFNRTFIPYFHNKLSIPSYTYFREIGIFIILLFSTVGLIGSLFVRDVFEWFINAKFLEASEIIPLLIFSHVATTLYFFFAAILFYDKKLIRLVPICTVSSAVIGIALNFFLVKIWGLWGAAFSQLASQVILFTMAIIISRKANPVKWNYVAMIAIFVIYATLSVAISHYLLLAGDVVWTMPLRIIISLIGIGICFYYYYLYIPNSLSRNILNKT